MWSRGADQTPERAHDGQRSTAASSLGDMWDVRRWNRAENRSTDETGRAAAEKAAQSHGIGEYSLGTPGSGGGGAR